MEQMLIMIRNCGFSAQMILPDENIGSIGKNKRHLVKRLPFYIGSVESERSLGTIEISKCPIRWVNILVAKGYEDPVDHICVFIIPDKRIRGIPPIHLKTVGHKNLPWIGMVTSLSWKGNVNDSDITSRFDNILSLNQTIIDGLNNRTGSNIEIDTESSLGRWVLTVNEIPTPKLWKCYQILGHELLPLPL